MSALLPVLLVAATVLAGCHGLEDLVETPDDGNETGDDPQDTSDDGTDTTDDADPPPDDDTPPASNDPEALSVTLVIENAPTTMEPDDKVVLSVKATGDSGKAQTAEVRVGSKSTASKSGDKLSTADFDGALAGPSGFSFPGTYNVAQWTPGKQADFFLRAHLVADGIHYWSPEKKVVVDAPAVEQVEGAADRTVTIGTGGSAATFSPGTVTITAGETVGWKNDDATGTPHTATSTGGPGSFDTGNIASGASSIVFRFNDVGTYDYECAYHASMVAKVTVQ